MFYTQLGEGEGKKDRAWWKKFSHDVGAVICWNERDWDWGREFSKGKDVLGGHCERVNDGRLCRVIKNTEALAMTPHQLLYYESFLFFFSFFFRVPGPCRWESEKLNSSIQAGEETGIGGGISKHRLRGNRSCFWTMGFRLYPRKRGLEGKIYQRTRETPMISRSTLLESSNKRDVMAEDF